MRCVICTLFVVLCQLIALFNSSLVVLVARRSMKLKFLVERPQSLEMCGLVAIFSTLLPDLLERSTGWLPAAVDSNPNFVVVRSITNVEANMPNDAWKCLDQTHAFAHLSEPLLTG